MKRGQRSRRLRNLIVAVAVLSLGACAASPIVAVPRPGADAKVPDQTLSYGIAYANNARDAYQQAISEQLAASNVLGSGLIGLGGIIAGLAAFGAHKDALIGAALGGGTAFALGNWNLNRQRLLVYQAGIEGINCSVRAVIPLYISPADLKALSEALATLEGHTVLVAASIERTKNASRNLGPDDPNKRLADQLVAESTTRLEQARAAVVSGRQFVTAATRAGPELVGAVDRIRGLVDKAVLDTIPDLSAVPKVVASLTGLAASFAPGVDTVSAAFASFGTRSQSTELTASAMPKELGEALDELRQRTAVLNTALVAVQVRLAGYDTAVSTSRLADCGVTGVDSALKASATRVQVTAGTDMSLRIVASGGTKPYSGTLLSAPADGLSLNTPLAFDSTFEVVAKKALGSGGPFTLLITDASNPPKQVSVEIAVTAAGSGGGGGGAAKSGATTSSSTMSEQGVLDMIKKAGSITDANKNVYTVVQDATKTLVSGAGDIVVTVTCKTAPASPATSAELKKAFYDANASDGAIKFAKDSALSVIFKSDEANCVKGSTASQSTDLANRGDQQLRTLPVAQIRAIQRSLCMPPEDVKAGAWGPHSREHLTKWRARRKAVGTGSADSVTQQEFAALFAADPKEVAARCQQ